MTAKLKSVEERDIALVLLYDPKDLAEIQLDRIRSNTSFDILFSGSQVPAIFLGSNQRSGDVKQGGFPCAVTAEQADAFPEWNFEGDGLQRVHLTETFGQFRADERCAPRAFTQELVCSFVGAGDMSGSCGMSADVSRKRWASEVS